MTGAIRRLAVDVGPLLTVAPDHMRGRLGGIDCIAGTIVVAFLFPVLLRYDTRAVT